MEGNLQGVEPEPARVGAAEMHLTPAPTDWQSAGAGGGTASTDNALGSLLAADVQFRCTARDLSGPDQASGLIW